jgi:hypothetical protein
MIISKGRGPVMEWMSWSGLAQGGLDKLSCQDMPLPWFPDSDSTSKRMVVYYPVWGRRHHHAFPGKGKAYVPDYCLISSLFFFGIFESSLACDMVKWRKTAPTLSFNL